MTDPRAPGRRSFFLMKHIRPPTIRSASLRPTPAYIFSVHPSCFSSPQLCLCCALCLEFPCCLYSFSRELALQGPFLTHLSRVRPLLIFPRWQQFWDHCPFRGSPPLAPYQSSSLQVITGVSLLGFPNVQRRPETKEVLVSRWLVGSMYNPQDFHLDLLNREPGWLVRETSGVCTMETSPFSVSLGLEPSSMGICSSLLQDTQTTFSVSIKEVATPAGSSANNCQTAK